MLKEINQNLLEACSTRLLTMQNMQDLFSVYEKIINVDGCLLLGCRIAWGDADYVLRT